MLNGKALLYFVINDTHDYLGVLGVLVRRKKLGMESEGLLKWEVISYPWLSFSNTLQVPLTPSKVQDMPSRIACTTSLRCPFLATTSEHEFSPW
jgi:hypothetical protein